MEPGTQYRDSTTDLQPAPYSPCITSAGLLGVVLVVVYYGSLVLSDMIIGARRYDTKSLPLPVSDRFKLAQ